MSPRLLRLDLIDPFLSEAQWQLNQRSFMQMAASVAKIRGFEMKKGFARFQQVGLGPG
jgi:hypothetical protein